MDLASFPKAAADVYVLVLEAGGGELGVAATAAALALADAGIEMFDLVAACTVVRRQAGARALSNRPCAMSNQPCVLSNQPCALLCGAGRGRWGRAAGEVPAGQQTQVRPACAPRQALSTASAASTVCGPFVLFHFYYLL